MKNIFMLKLKSNFEIKKVLYDISFRFIKKSKQEKWSYLYLYNDYFCSCKGLNCLNIEINKKCKY